MICIHSKHSCNTNKPRRNRPPAHAVITIILLLLVISIQFTLLAAAATGRRILQNPVSRSQEEDLSLRVGSRPPRCENRCATCGHCEAIQIPTPRTRRSKNDNSTGGVYKITYSRSDVDNSNYKPMSWKCKCGNIILNP